MFVCYLSLELAFCHWALAHRPFLGNITNQMLLREFPCQCLAIYFWQGLSASQAVILTPVSEWLLPIPAFIWSLDCDACRLFCRTVYILWCRTCTYHAEEQPNHFISFFGGSFPALSLYLQAVNNKTIAKCCWNSFGVASWCSIGLSLGAVGSNLIHIFSGLHVMICWIKKNKIY